MAHRELGLYFHIPFCSYVCHYCDFAKTANFNADLVDRYFAVLESQLAKWLDYFGKDLQIVTVFFGGGTPSLFTEHYQRLFASFAPFLAEKAEISLEANPENINVHNLRYWRELGINRLSIGIQSFQEEALRFLTRQHDAKRNAEAIEIAAKIFDNLNVDLIYGWPGQDHPAFADDLSKVLDFKIPHLSLYTLTYEKGTVLGRRKQRGLLHASDDDVLADLYELACSTLLGAGYVHEEVSNWSRPGFSCVHNWRYWSNLPVIGIGAGAHGFFHNGGRKGIRYAYPRQIQSFLRHDEGDSLWNGIALERDDEALLIELVACQLRTRTGIDLVEIQRTLPYTFEANQLIKQAIDAQSIDYRNGILRLKETEWFRENSWALAILESFHPRNPEIR